MEVHVYDENDNLLLSDISSDYSVPNDIVLKPGDDLRKLGFINGIYKVKYNFFRYLAGRNSSILVKTTNGKENELYSGPAEYTNTPTLPYWVSTDGRVFSGVEGQTVEPEELEIRELKFVVDKISTNKKEIRLIPQDIKNLSRYNTEFESLYMWENVYTPTRVGDTPNGRLTIPTSNQNTIVLELLANGDMGVNGKMIGGLLTVKNAFITEYNTTAQSLTEFKINDLQKTYLSDKQRFWNSSDSEWDSSLHADAIRLAGVNTLGGGLISYGYTD